MFTQKTYEQVLEEIKFLAPDSVMLVYARLSQNNENKVILEFRHRKPNGVNLLAMMNADDPAFNQTEPVYCWETWGVTVTQKQLGINFDEFQTETITTKNGKELDVYVLGIVDPQIAGNLLKAEIKEATTPFTKRQMDNPEASIKTNGKGQYLSFEGKPIYRNVSMKFESQVKDVYLQHDAVLDSIDEFELIESSVEA
jgi:hypothetical protein